MVLKRRGFIILAGLGFGSVLLGYNLLQHQNIEKYAKTDYAAEEEQISDFISRNLMSADGGIYSYYKRGEQENKEYFGRGHEILSESTGLLMQYAVMKGDKNLFEKEFRFMKENQMEKERGVLYWKLDENLKPLDDSGYYSNAPIDDFRVIKSLFAAKEKWGDERYADMALRLSEGQKREIDKDGFITSHFQWGKEGESHGNSVITCFVDFGAMKEMGRHDDFWKKVSVANLPIVLNAQTPCGAFWQEYDLKTKTYKNPPYINGSETILMAFSAGNLADFNRKREALRTLSFFEREYEKGVISGAYEPESCKGIGEEDIGTYASVAQLAIKLGDKEFARGIIDEKILPNKNDLGALSFEDGDASSFVNIQSVISLHMLQE